MTLLFTWDARNQRLIVGQRPYSKLNSSLHSRAAQNPQFYPTRTWSPSHFWIYWPILGTFQPGQTDSNGTALVMREKSPWEDSGGYLQMTKSLSCEIISGRFGGVWRCAKITYVWVSQLISAACQHLHRYLIWETSPIPAQTPPFPPSWIS